MANLIYLAPPGQMLGWNRWGNASPRDLQGSSQDDPCRSSWDEKRYRIPKDYVPDDEWRFTAPL